ncbi:MAG TPA: hypothetical protein VNJ51_07860 [Candidatus Dormibacteraeota bacterium]|nr:hypothetical protein [Candidatus Dormibacteraeota bacterium]
MTTELYAEEEVQRSAEDAVKDLVEHLSAGSGEARTHGLTVPFDEIGLPDIGQFSREVEVTIGAPEQHRAIVDLYSTWIPIEWSVPDNRMLPAFSGFIEVTPLGRTFSQVAVFGHYTPPGGWVGAGFDAMVGRRIAEATVRNFVAGLKKQLEGK